MAQNILTPEEKKYLGKVSRYLASLGMTYGEIKGSDRLRNAIAALYNKQSSVNVVVTHGTIGANMLVHKTLVEHGDHVISIVPTYQQHYSIPHPFFLCIAVIIISHRATSIKKY